jgi:heme/copper-type cytochrome/quinol oxidase subunit 2
MLTLSVLWVMLAALVTVVAMIRRSAGETPDYAKEQVKESGNALAFIAVVCSLVLLVGFVYVGRFLVSGL